MITYSRGPLRIVESWFKDADNYVRADIIRYFQMPQSTGQSSCRSFYTPLLNLTTDEDVIFAGFKKDTRNEIRRARDKDAITFESWDSVPNQILTEFSIFYNEFAARKGIARLGPRLRAAGEKRMLWLSRTASTTGHTLVWHAYLISAARARLLYSASCYRDFASAADRALIGRANRLHHWLDMINLKAAQVCIYDFGGWYEGRSDLEKLRINHFKGEFGGRVVREFNFEVARTSIGRAALQMLPIMQQASMKRWLGSRRRIADAYLRFRSLAGGR